MNGIILNAFLFTPILFFNAARLVELLIQGTKIRYTFPGPSHLSVDEAHRKARSSSTRPNGPFPHTDGTRRWLHELKIEEVTCATNRKWELRYQFLRSLSCGACATAREPREQYEGTHLGTFIPRDQLRREKQGEPAKNKVPSASNDGDGGGRVWRKAVRRITVPKMPQDCAFGNCKNVAKSGSGCRFFCFPSERLQGKRRKLWIAAVAAVNRTNENGTPWRPPSNSRLESAARTS